MVDQKKIHKAHEKHTSDLTEEDYLLLQYSNCHKDALYLYDKMICQDRIEDTNEAIKTAAKGKVSCIMAISIGKRLEAYYNTMKEFDKVAELNSQLNMLAIKAEDTTELMDMRKSGKTEPFISRLDKVVEMPTPVRTKTDLSNDILKVRSFGNKIEPDIMRVKSTLNNVIHMDKMEVRSLKQEPSIWYASNLDVTGKRHLKEVLQDLKNDGYKATKKPETKEEIGLARISLLKRLYQAGKITEDECCRRISDITKELKIA
jgi:hypothetical protein